MSESSANIPDYMLNASVETLAEWIKALHQIVQRETKMAGNRFTAAHIAALYRMTEISHTVRLRHPAEFDLMFGPYTLGLEEMVEVEPRTQSPNMMQFLSDYRAANPGFGGRVLPFKARRGSKVQEGRKLDQFAHDDQEEQ